LPLHLLVPSDIVRSAFWFPVDFWTGQPAFRVTSRRTKSAQLLGVPIDGQMGLSPALSHLSPEILRSAFWFLVNFRIGPGGPPQSLLVGCSPLSFFVSC
jgi:hypothetical protein